MIELIYQGHPTFVSLLAQMLTEGGVGVVYEPPVETRSGVDIARDVIVGLACNGTYDAVKAAIAKFKATRLGQSAVIQIHIDSDDELQDDANL